MTITGQSCPSMDLTRAEVIPLVALIFRRNAARVGPEVGVELPVVRAGH